MKEKLETRILHAYQVERTIKEGEESRMLLLRHSQTGERAIFRQYAGDGAVYKKLREVNCPHLPRILDVETEEGRVTVLEAYVPGDNLEFLLHGGTLPVKTAVDIACQLCEALTVLHSFGAVHRDVKPENIILNGNRAVLVDFDAARICKPDQSKDTRIMGTTGFAAPEQYGFGQTDARTDVFSMGILLNVMVTGHHPSQQLAEGRLRPIIETCTAVNADRRYASARELQKALRRKRHRWIPVTAAAAAALAVGLWWFRPVPAQPELPAPEVPPTVEETPMPETIPSTAAPARPMTAEDLAPQALLEKDRKQMGPVPVSYGGQTYYVGPTEWGRWVPLQHDRQTITQEETLERVLSIGVWKQEEDRLVPVEEELRQQLLEENDLELHLYGGELRGNYPEILEKTEHEATCLFADGTDNFWYSVVTGTVEEQPVMAVGCRQLLIQQIESHKVASVEEANKLLASLPWEEKRIHKLCFPAGTMEGTLVVPASVNMIHLAGDPAGTVIHGGVDANGGDTFLFDLQFVGRGKKQVEDNIGLYGKGMADCVRCSFTGFDIGILSTENLRFGGQEVTLRQNRVGCRVDTVHENGGNPSMEKFTFEENDIGLEFRRVNPQLPGSWYRIRNSYFFDNGQDVVNHTEQTLYVGENTFSHHGEATAVVQGNVVLQPELPELDQALRQQRPRPEQLHMDFSYDLDGDGTPETYTFGVRMNIEIDGRNIGPAGQDNLLFPDESTNLRFLAPCVWQKEGEHYVDMPAFASLLEQPKTLVYCMEQKGPELPVLQQMKPMEGTWEGCVLMEQNLHCAGLWLAEVTATLDGQALTACAVMNLTHAEE